MESRPPITVSKLDLARLERLVYADANKNRPGIEALQDELDRATVVDPTEVPPDLVTMNSRVRFVDDATGATSELTLVYPDGASGPDTVSVLAPAGAALLGLTVGQSIAWQVPGGRSLRLRILGIAHQPEAEGQFNR
ncbi:MAG: nucleoside diphosphate kinase regulator [Gammaproteobacteria bacterium PRO9]|nr:nucleoside diphosphate kinase regulator [Gammaproteobacteria bacterium PRO9]